MAQQIINETKIKSLIHKYLEMKFGESPSLVSMNKRVAFSRVKNKYITKRIITINNFAVCSIGGFQEDSFSIMKPLLDEVRLIFGTSPILTSRTIKEWLSPKLFESN